MNKKQLRQTGVGLVVPAIAILVWQAACVFGKINPQMLPSPLAVAEKWLAYLLPLQPHTGGSWLAWAVSGEMLLDSVTSMYRVVLGFLIGAGLALPLGLGMG